jgi:hypothetical protein
MTSTLPLPSFGTSVWIYAIDAPSRATDTMPINTQSAVVTDASNQLVASRNEKNNENHVLKKRFACVRVDLLSSSLSPRMSWSENVLMIGMPTIHKTTDARI